MVEQWLSAGSVADIINAMPELHPQERRFTSNTVNKWRSNLPDFLVAQQGGWKYRAASPYWIGFGLRLKRHFGFDAPNIKAVFEATVNYWGATDALSQMEALYDSCEDFRVYLWRLMEAGVTLPDTLQQEAAKPVTLRRDIT